MKITDKRKTELKDLINTMLDERLKGVNSFNDKKTFIGYNPIEKIRNGLFHWIAVPFNGINIYCQLRCPNATQIEQCGSISNIIDEKLQKDDTKQIDYDEIITIRNYQEELCKVTFNIPTFDNIFELIGEKDFNLTQKRKELAEIENKFNENKNNMSNADKIEINKEIEKLKLQIGFILPDDTMAFITRWAVGNDVSDIKKINRDTFLKAAVLAQINHKAPTDYISGTFTDHDKSDIDAYAISIYQDFKKDQQTVKESEGRWFFGGRKRSKNEEILPK